MWLIKAIDFFVQTTSKNKWLVWKHKAIVLREQAFSATSTTAFYVLWASSGKVTASYAFE